jgi:hypothetical protein
MFSSNYVYNVNDIPTTWILETYLDLPYKLSGQSIKIKSLFNAADKDPSMVFYWRDKYVFKDFSSGKSGGTIDAMMGLFKMNFQNTANKIINDYKIYLDKGNSADIEISVEPFHWTGTGIKVRSWNTMDVKFWWKQHNAGSDLLTQYNIKPIETYTLNKVLKSGDVVESYQIGPAQLIYGYFKNDGTLYKIYRPKLKKGKFISLDNNYIQGLEQLSGEVDTLVIAASMKDLLVLKSLKLKIDILAPPSENTLLSEGLMEDLKERYDNIVALLDPDEAGKKAMEKYKEQHGVGICYIPYKDDGDISEVMKLEGKSETLMKVVPALSRAIEKYKLQNVTV